MQEGGRSRDRFALKGPYSLRSCNLGLTEASLSLEAQASLVPFGSLRGRDAFHPFGAASKISFQGGRLDATDFLRERRELAFSQSINLLPFSGSLSLSVSQSPTLSVESRTS